MHLWHNVHEMKLECNIKIVYTSQFLYNVFKCFAGSFTVVQAMVKLVMKKLLQLNNVWYILCCPQAYFLTFEKR